MKEVQADEEDTAVDVDTRGARPTVVWGCRPGENLISRLVELATDDLSVIGFDDTKLAPLLSCRDRESDRDFVAETEHRDDSRLQAQQPAEGVDSGQSIL